MSTSRAVSHCLVHPVSASKLPTPSPDWRILGRLLSFVRPYTKQLATAIAITLIVSGLGPLRPWLFRHAIDTMTATETWSTFFIYSGAIAGVLVLYATLQVSQSYLLQWIGQRTLHDMRQHIFQHILRLPFSTLDATPVGRLITRVTNDVEALNELFSSGVVMIISDVLVLAWILVFMVATDLELTLYTLGVIPPLLLAAAIFRSKVRRVYSAIRTQVARMNAFLNEHIQGITTIQLFNYHRPQAERFDAINREHTRLQLKTVTYYASFFPVVEFLSVSALCLVLYAAYGKTVGGTVSIGTVVSFLMYGEMFFRPVRDLTEKYNILQTATTASERIFSLLDQPVEEASAPTAHTPAQPLRQGIQLRNLHFSYDRTTPVLKDIHLDIPAGSFVAIVGTTGSGKSTLANLLLKFYAQQQGDILFDGIELGQIETRSHRRRCAIVLQDPYLFSRSTEQNIALGRQINIDAAWDILRRMRPYLVERLCHIMHHQERGSSLSAGERQIIALLRAVAGNPQLIILDEATAHLDSETEQIIMDIIASIRGRTTIIAIAHRLASIRNADLIVVLHCGTIVERGTHAELIAAGGYYATLYRLQQLDPSRVATSDRSSWSTPALS